MIDGSVTIVMAHPDDEILWGWPVFFDKTLDRKLLMCSSDAKNPERAWCSHRKNPMIKLCELYDVEVECVDYNSSFYKTPSRYAPPPHLADVCYDIADRISKIETDYIMTHNPVGEYGHFDHRLLFNLCLENSKVPILITDISMKSNWYSYEKVPDNLSIYYQNKISEHTLDTNEFTECAKYYKDENVWTWSREIPTQCSLYKIN